MNRKNDGTIVFVGGSFTSMLTALHLLKHNPKEKIVIIEKETELGGLYRNFKYSETNIFDHGVHIYTETCNPEIDDLVFDLLPENEWMKMEGKFRDVSGTYYNGKLQTNTPFIDIRNLNEEQKNKYIGEIFSSLANDPNPLAYKNTEDYLNAKYGKSLTQDIMAKILHKHYDTEVSRLDPTSTHVIPVSRVVLFDDNVMSEFMGSKSVRSRLAFPDQFNLPGEFLRKGRLLYPRKYGIHQLIKLLEQKLVDQGVKFVMNATVNSMQSNDQQVTAIEIKTVDQIQSINNIKHLFWGVGVVPLARQLELKLPEHKPEFKKGVFVNMRLNLPPNTGLMYYVYCFDENYSTFRVTNYASYCPTARNEDGFPICVTLWPKKDFDGDYCKLAEEELRSMKLLSDYHKVNFAKAEIAGTGFPNPTVESANFVDTARSKIKDLNINNLDLTGTMSEKGLFYLTEILEHSFKVANAKLVQKAQVTA